MKTPRNTHHTRLVSGLPPGFARVLALAACLTSFISTATARPCDIYIGSYSTVTICADISVNCITVDSGGTLQVCAGNTLTLTGHGDSTVNGVVNLLGDSAELAFTTWSHTVYGGGSIVGFHDNAEISIVSGKTLTNETNIVGQLKITGDGTFVNCGTVEANSAGTILIDVGTLDDCAGTCRWVVSHVSAKLHFASTIGTLNAMAGEFCLTAGTCEIDHALTTTGNLDIDGGTFQVDATSYFGTLEFTGGSIVVADSVACTFY